MGPLDFRLALGSKPISSMKLSDSCSLACSFLISPPPLSSPRMAQDAFKTIACSKEPISSPPNMVTRQSSPLYSAETSPDDGCPDSASLQQGSEQVERQHGLEACPLPWVQPPPYRHLLQGARPEGTSAGSGFLDLSPSPFAVPPPPRIGYREQPSTMAAVSPPVVQHARLQREVLVPGNNLTHGNCILLSCSPQQDKANRTSLLHRQHMFPDWPCPSKWASEDGVARRPCASFPDAPVASHMAGPAAAPRGHYSLPAPTKGKVQVSPNSNRRATSWGGGPCLGAEMQSRCVVGRPGTHLSTEDPRWDSLPCAASMRVAPTVIMAETVPPDDAENPETPRAAAVEACPEDMSKPKGHVDKRMEKLPLKANAMTEADDGGYLPFGQCSTQEMQAYTKVPMAPGAFFFAGAAAGMPPAPRAPSRQLYRSTPDSRSTTYYELNATSSPAAPSSKQKVEATKHVQRLPCPPSSIVAASTVPYPSDTHGTAKESATAMTARGTQRSIGSAAQAFKHRALMRPHGPQDKCERGSPTIRTSTSDKTSSPASRVTETKEQSGPLCDPMAVSALSSPPFYIGNTNSQVFTSPPSWDGNRSDKGAEGFVGWRLEDRATGNCHNARSVTQVKCRRPVTLSEGQQKVNASAALQSTPAADCMQQGCGKDYQFPSPHGLGSMLNTSMDTSVGNSAQRKSKPTLLEHAIIDHSTKESANPINSAFSAPESTKHMRTSSETSATCSPLKSCLRISESSDKLCAQRPKNVSFSKGVRVQHAVQKHSERVSKKHMK